jgi:hypothetical protein
MENRGLGLRTRVLGVYSGVRSTGVPFIKCIDVYSGGTSSTPEYFIMILCFLTSMFVLWRLRFLGVLLKEKIGFDELFI